MFKIILFTMALSPLVQAKQVKFKNLSNFDSCISENSYDINPCKKALDKYIKAHHQEALAAAKKVRLNMAHHQALDFFEIALKTDQKICKDEDFQLSMLSALSLPPQMETNKKAQKIFKDSCFVELQSSLEKELTKEPTGYFADNVCAILSVKKIENINCVKKPDVVAQPTQEKLPVVDVKKAGLEDLVKTYKGPEGETVSIASVKGQEHLFVIKISGIKGDWNNRSLLHQESVRSGGRSDVWTEKDGKSWVTLVINESCCGKSIEVNVPGAREFMAYYSTDDSKKTSAQDILSTFKK